MRADEAHRVREPFGQQTDIEARFVHPLFLRCQQIEEEGGHALTAQGLRNKPVTRRVPPRAAAVGEHHDAMRPFGDVQNAFEHEVLTGGNGNGQHFHRGLHALKPDLMMMQNRHPSLRNIKLRARSGAAGSTGTQIAKARRGAGSGMS